MVAMRSLDELLECSVGVQVSGLVMISTECNAIFPFLSFERTHPAHANCPHSRELIDTGE